MRQPDDFADVLKMLPEWLDSEAGCHRAGPSYAYRAVLWRVVGYLEADHPDEALAIAEALKRLADLENEALRAFRRIFNKHCSGGDL